MTAYDRTLTAWDTLRAHLAADSVPSDADEWRAVVRAAQALVDAATPLAYPGGVGADDHRQPYRIDREADSRSLAAVSGPGPCPGKGEASEGVAGHENGRPLAGLVTAAEWSGLTPHFCYLQLRGGGVTMAAVDDRRWAVGSADGSVWLEVGEAPTMADKRRAAVAALRRLGATVPEEANR